MKISKSFVIESPGKGSVKSIAIPEISEDEFLVEVRACGICTTDRRMFQGELRVPFPVIGGHEISGRIISGNFSEDLKAGDVVALDMINRCGYCFYCRKGLDNLCLNSRKARVIEGKYLIAGGFSEYVVAKRQQIFKVNVDPEVATLVEPLACCINSVEKANIQAGESVLIMGAGTMGILHAMLVSLKGAIPFLSDPSEERRKFASSLNMKALKPEMIFKELSSVNEGHGFDAVFITAPVAKLPAQAIEVVRKGGRVVLYTSIHPSVDMALDWNRIHYSELSIYGTEGRRKTDFARAAALIQKMKLSPLITKKIQLGELSLELSNSPAPKDQRTVVVF